MTTVIQDKPPPPWRNTRLAGTVRTAQRAIAARRFMRAHNAALPAKAPVLNFYPMLPVPKAHIRVILDQLGLRIGTRPGGPGATIAWDSETGFSRAAAARLPADAINARCLDIGKSRVDRDWAIACGYSVEVDPLTFDGLMVVKSEINGQHDGRVTQGPLTRRRPGMVYQRYVNAEDDGHMLELRTAVIGGQIPSVIRKWRPGDDWSAYSVRSDVHLGSEVYAPTEIQHLLAFAAQIGMDYGELDVLRDNDSGRVYVLDANRTPYGPPRKLARAEAQRAARLMAEAFAALLATHG